MIFFEELPDIVKCVQVRETNQRTLNNKVNKIYSENLHEKVNPKGLLVHLNGVDCKRGRFRSGF